MSVVHDSGEQLRDQLLARPIKPFVFSSTAGSAEIISRPCLVVSWSARETSGSAAASFRIRSGGSATGAIVAAASMVANGSSVGPGGDEGVFCDAGVFAESVSGAFEGAVWARV